MAEKLSALALGYGIAILAAIHMLLLGILGSMGVYMGAVDLMMQVHLFFSLGLVGIITGIIEGAVMGFICGYLIAYFYNMFVE